jgi:nucleotide-binding universal stress UspA family protein
MNKDVMVRLEGTAADDLRLMAVGEAIKPFDGIVIGLFLNVMPSMIPGEGYALLLDDLMRQAREAGNAIQAALTVRLKETVKRFELRRFDIFDDEVATFAAREARSADAFVALSPAGSLHEAEDLIEGVLFGSGHHLLLVPDRRLQLNHRNVIVAWNGSRESARALAEAMPYLQLARNVTIIVVDDEPPAEERALLGMDAKKHLKYHGIDAILHHTAARDGDVAGTLIAEAVERDSSLIVAGGYGHSRLREWLLGGVTYKLLHRCPIPMLIAH